MTSNELIIHDGAGYLAVAERLEIIGGGARVCRRNDNMLFCFKKVVFGKEWFLNEPVAVPERRQWWIGT